MSDRNYHTLGGRIQYRARSSSFPPLPGVDNENAPLSFTTYSSRSRHTTRRLRLLAGLADLRCQLLEAAPGYRGGLAFFAGIQSPQLQTSYDSIYISNIHAANAGLRFGIGHRADLYAGYTITKDTGDGRSSAVPVGVTDPIAALLDSVQTFL